MLTKLKGGKIYDPAHGINGEVRDIFIRDGRIIAAPSSEQASQEFDLSGKVVMAGAIDMHTHIGGGKVTIARNLLYNPSRHNDNPSSAWTVRHDRNRPASNLHAAPGRLYGPPVLGFEQW